MSYYYYYRIYIYTISLLRIPRFIHRVCIQQDEISNSVDGGYTVDMHHTNKYTSTDARNSYVQSPPLSSIRFLDFLRFPMALIRSLPTIRPVMRTRISLCQPFYTVSLYQYYNNYHPITFS